MIVLNGGKDDKSPCGEILEIVTHDFNHLPEICPAGRQGIEWAKAATGYIHHAI